MSTATTPLARPRTRSKHLLWYALGLAGISVLIITDYPLFFHPTPGDPFHAKMIVDRYFLIPHAIAGVLATALGPFQFSTRFRQRHLATHRLMGKVYIISIFFAAPMVFILSRGFTFSLAFMGSVQAVALAPLHSRRLHHRAQSSDRHPPPMDDPLLRLHAQLHFFSPA